MPKKKLISSTQNKIKGNRVSLSYIYQEFDKCNQIKNLSVATIRYYKDCYERFCRFYLSDDINEINEKVIGEYILYLRRETNCNERTLQSYIRGLRAFIYYSMKMGYVKNFIIQLPKAQDEGKETYTDEELYILLKKPSIKDTDFSELRNWVIINFFLGTGCSASTLCSVKIKDIDFNNGIIQFTKTKNKRSATVPLSKELEKVLKEYLKYYDGEAESYLLPSIYGGKLTVEGLKSAIDRYNKKRGVMRTSLHAFRHTFAKTWIMNGGDIFRLQKILQHSCLDMVRNYVNLYGQDLQRDYDKYNPLSKFSQSMGSKLKIK